MVFWLIFLSVPSATVAWWVLTHRAVGRLPVAAGRRLVMRAAVGAFFFSVLSVFVWIMVERLADAAPPPTWARTWTFVWFIAALPASLAIWLVTAITLRAWRKPAAMGPPGPAAGSVAAAAGPPAELSRRDFLTLTAVAAPPLLTAGFSIKAHVEHGTFQTREHLVRVDGLPRELEGVTIAHVSDIHIGRYTDAPLLRKIVEQTNNLRCDLIALTGDLIDFDIDELPTCIDMLRRFDAPSGVVICEGNHDLFQDPGAFRYGLKTAGLNLLLNESITHRIRGVECEVSGLQWGLPGKQMRAAGLKENFGHLQALLGGNDGTKPAGAIADSRRAPFRLHLAHHPHAFELAGQNGVDLTLAGHTHGGQLMLADGIGPASFVYKYLSGLYSEQNTAGRRVSCVVSNGTGNWFPLRLGAPAEISKITLVRA